MVERAALETATTGIKTPAKKRERTAGNSGKFTVMIRLFKLEYMVQLYALIWIAFFC